MSVEDVLTMGQRIRVEALDAALRTIDKFEANYEAPQALDDARKAAADCVLGLAKTFKDYIAKETWLSAKPADKKEPAHA